MASDTARLVIHRAYEQGRVEERQLLLSYQSPWRRVALVMLERLDAGPQPAEAMLALAGEMGVSTRAVYRAKAKTRVVSVKQRDRWVWVHPRHVSTTTAKVDKVDAQLAFVVDSVQPTQTDDWASA